MSSTSSPRDGNLPEVTILVPLFNEAQVFPKLECRLTALADQWDFPTEILFVDDGSKDSTPDLVRARGKAVAILDADLQDPPELLSEFVARWREGNQVVYGIREKRKEGLLKRATYSLFYRLLDRLSTIPIPRDAGDFCLMDRRVVDELTAMPERSRFLRGMRSWAGFRQVGVPYERAARAGGTPQYTWKKLFQLGLDGLLSFSHAPLRLATVVGFLTGVAAFSLLLFYVGWWASGGAIAGRKPEDVGGFMTITTLLLFFSSIQFLLFGVLGEYVGRMFLEVKQRPGWIVAEHLGFVETESSPRSAEPAHAR
jgi:glycosyltransferase involved in cell wall biosynthesis